MEPFGAFGEDALPEDLRFLIKPELAPGERLLWAARSQSRLPLGSRAPLMTGALWAAGFFLVCLSSIGLLNALGPRARDVDGFLIVVAIIAGIIGLFVTIATITNVLTNGTAGQKLKGRVYALTDHRAIVWSPQPRSPAVKVHTIPRGAIRTELVHRVQYPDGSGDVLFRNAYEDPNGFAGIADVRRVEELVRRFLIVPGSEASRERGPSLDDGDPDELML